jgi:hypothetical protein
MSDNYEDDEYMYDDEDGEDVEMDSDEDVDDGEPVVARALGADTKASFRL